MGESKGGGGREEKDEAANLRRHLTNGGTKQKSTRQEGKENHRLGDDTGSPLETGSSSDVPGRNGGIVGVGRERVGVLELVRGLVFPHVDGDDA